MSDQPALLLRTRWGTRATIVQLDALVVRHPEIPAELTAGDVERTDILEILPSGDGVLPRGDRRRINGAVRVFRSTAAVKSAVRRLRVDDAASLDVIDLRIHLLEADLADSRAKRARLVSHAWPRSSGSPSSKPCSQR